MASTSRDADIDVSKLQQFHACHYPGQSIPDIGSAVVCQESQNTQQNMQEDEEESDDSLGYYEDGTKRTLTDEQIRMFRFSEIQRLLVARRNREAEGGKTQAQETSEKDTKTAARRDAEHKTSNKVNGASRKGQRERHFSDAPQDNDIDILLDY